jgi:hypothetical protein
MTALAQVIALILYPPDFSGEFPVYSPKMVLILEFGLAFDLIGLTIMGMKAEEDRYILAAGGFTAQAISIGLAAAGLFEILSIASREAYEKFYYITVSSNFLYFPSLILIATYGKFKRWVRIAGFMASLPLLTSTILFVVDYRDFVVLEEISSLGYILIILTQLFWAGNIYVNYKNSLKQTVH